MKRHRLHAWLGAAGALGAALGGVACNALTDVPEGYLVDADSGQVEDVATPPADSGVDTGPPSFCSTVSPAPKVCSDFDEQPSDPTAGWDNEGRSPDPAIVGGGQRALDGQHFHSSPFSLALTLPALPTSTETAAVYLIKSIPSSPETMIVSEEVYLSNLTVPLGNGGTFLLTVLFGNDLNNGAGVIVDEEGAALSISTPTASTRVGFTAATGDPAPWIPFDDWVQIDFVITKWPSADSGTGLSIDVTASGTKGYNAEATAPLPFVPAGMPAFVIVGLQGAGPLDKIAVNIDDVYVGY